MSDSKGLSAVIETSKGNIRLKLFPHKAPITAANFVNLARRNFFQGLTFHRVIDNFMIQGGCPSGDGRGGPGYKFQDEMVKDLKHDKPGILSMANAGPGTNGSQFFITHAPTPWLNGKHTIFGEVVDREDQKVVNKIVSQDQIKNIVIQGDYSDLFKKTKAYVNKWNEILDKKFPDLAKAEPIN